MSRTAAVGLKAVLSCTTIGGVFAAGFGVPNRRKRVFVLASLHGDARDVLLSQVNAVCGSCVILLCGSDREN